MSRYRQHSAFTLVELMVSVGIALILMAGINTVFRSAAQASGTGNSLLSVTRDARTVFQTFLADTSNIDAVSNGASGLGDAPFFIIRSDRVYTFRNLADQQSASSSTNPSYDTKLFPNYPGNICPVVVPSFRNHRVDRLAFFARGSFFRQTSSDARFASMTKSNEAFIYFGHAQQPSRINTTASGSTWYDPGASTPTVNPYNYYASDFMLARMALLLVPQNPQSPTDSNYISGATTPLAPFVGATGQVHEGAGEGTLSMGVSGSPSLNQGLLDLADCSITSYNQRTNGIKTYGPTGSNYKSNWMGPLIAYRLQSSPFILANSVNGALSTQQKILPTNLAQCAPDLIRGCSQFIVEYASNNYTKDAYGNPAALPTGGPQTVPVPDPTGQVDFLTDSAGFKHIRWYGYPRSTTGNARLDPTTGDVVPLRDVYSYFDSQYGTSWALTYADAEYLRLALYSNNFPSYKNMMSGGGYLASGVMPANAYYTAAWGPDVQYQPFPKMIRITIEVDDHEGRLRQPQRYEFIYDVSQ